jgi:hypothetical protein
VGNSNGGCSRCSPDVLKPGHVRRSFDLAREITQIDRLFHAQHFPRNREPLYEPSQSESIVVHQSA